MKYACHKVLLRRKAVMAAGLHKQVAVVHKEAVLRMVALQCLSLAPAQRRALPTARWTPAVSW